MESTHNKLIRKLLTSSSIQLAKLLYKFFFVKLNKIYFKTIKF
jgi:hypothetical protein